MRSVILYYICFVASGAFLNLASVTFIVKLTSHVPAGSGVRWAPLVEIRCPAVIANFAHCLSWGLKFVAPLGASILA